MIHRLQHMRETGHALFLERDARCLTLQQVADGIGVHVSVVSRWERGERMMSTWDRAVLDEFMKIAAARMHARVRGDEVSLEVVHGHE